MCYNVSMIKKIDILMGYINAGQWDKALSLAAKFPRLGKEKDAIVSADTAQKYPRFYAEIGKDVAATVAEGIAALKRRYCR